MTDRSATSVIEITELPSGTCERMVSDKKCGVPGCSAHRHPCGDAGHLFHAEKEPWALDLRQAIAEGRVLGQTAADIPLLRFFCLCDLHHVEKSS